MTRATIKISVKQIVLAFCFISFYIPQSYAVPGFVYTVWRASYMIVGLGATLLLFLNARKKTPSKGYFALMAFYLWIFVFSLVFSSTSEFKLYNFVKCVGFISLLEFALLTRNKKKVIEAFLAAVIFISIIHFISFVQYSNLRGGMRHGINYYTAGILRVNSNQNWYFLTYDNNSIYYFLPAIVLLLYYSCNYNIKAIRLWIAYSGFILYMFLVKVSAAALVAMSVIIAGYFLFIRSNKRSPLNHLLSYKNTVLVGMIISIIPVLVVGGELAFNLTSLFGKRTGFSGRDIIWSKSVVQIFRNFLFGYGFEDSAITWQKINQTHCHNIILELLYVGGIVGFALFCLALFCYRPNRITLGTKIFAIVIFAYYVVGSMDWLAYNPLPMSIFVFNYYLSNDGPMNMHLA